MIRLLFCLQLPKICYELAIHYKKNVVSSFLYHITSFKYCVWDVYDWQTKHSSETLSVVFLGGLLLLNLTHFTYSLACHYQERLRSQVHATINEQLMSLCYFSKIITDYSSPPLFIAHITLAITAHSYFTQRSQCNGYYYFYFYTFALHAITLLEITDILQNTPNLLLLSFLSHFVIYSTQTYVYTYRNFNTEKTIDALSVVCKCVDYLILFKVRYNFEDYLMLWRQTLQFYSIFLLLYLECFGHLTSCIVHFLLMYTQDKNPLSFSNFNLEQNY